MRWQRLATSFSSAAGRPRPRWPALCLLGLRHGLQIRRPCVCVSVCVCVCLCMCGAFMPVAVSCVETGGSSVVCEQSRTCQVPGVRTKNQGNLLQPSALQDRFDAAISAFTKARRVLAACVRCVPACMLHDVLVALSCKFISSLLCSC